MARLFTEILGEIARGALLADIQNALVETTEAVELNGGVGEITIKVKLKQNDTGVVTVDGDVSHKKPKRKRGSTIFYVASDKSLVREDPRQKKFPFDATAVERTGTEG